MIVKNILKKIFFLLEKPQWFLFASIFFRLTLEIAYINFVYIVFSYSGFNLEASFFKYIESWVLFFIFLFLLSPILRKPSEYFMAYLLYVFITPLLVFYSLTNASREHLYIIVIGVLLIDFFRRGKPFALPLIRASRPFAIFLLVSGIVAVSSWMVCSGGLQFFNLDLLRVYEFRRVAGEVINQNIMGYLNVWAIKAFGPALLAFALWKKYYSVAIVVLGLHILWFGISSHKGVLFYPFLVIFLWVWFRKSRALSLIPISMSVVILISYFIFLLLNESFIGSLFIRRVFFIPPFLTFIYYEFFSINEFVYWSYSITSSFIDYPYHINPALLIGSYLGTEEAHANNSFLSTGYMHAGIAGIIFYGVVVGVLFRLIDSIAFKGIPSWVAIAVVIVPTQSLLISTDLPTALSTHGLGVAILILFLLRIRQKLYAKIPHTRN